MFGSRIWRKEIQRCHFQESCQISEMLIAAGASIDDYEVPGVGPCLDLNGPLHNVTMVGTALDNLPASRKDDLRRFVKYMINLGFSVDDINSLGETPFLHGSKSKCIRSTLYLELLLESGANPNARDFSGNGALHLFLLDKYETNALLCWLIPPRSWVENPEQLKDRLLFLLHAGCDPYAVCDNGYSVGDVAELRGLGDIWQSALSTFSEKSTQAQGSESAQLP